MPVNLILRLVKLLFKYGFRVLYKKTRLGVFMRKMIVKIVVAVVIVATAITLIATGVAGDVASQLLQLIPKVFVGITG